MNRYFEDELGVGSVITTYALIRHDAISRNQLEKAIMKDYETSRRKSEMVVNLAFTCGVLREEDGLVYVVGREEALGKGK